LTVDFDNYEPKERLCLIRYFRNRLAEEVQTGWDMFCHSVANPLRDYVPEGVPTPSADEVTLTRRRWDWYFIPLILLSAVFGIVAWWKFQLPRMLAAPLLPTALWLFLRFGTPKQGMVARRISADPEHKRWLVFLLSWFCVGMVSLVVFKPMNPPRPHDIVVATVGVILWFVGLFLRAYLLDRGMQQRKSEAANVSVQQWNDGDPSQDE
jgi:hypothetical protein